MKTTVVLICVALYSISLNGQELKERDVPAIVKDSFKAKYPNVYVYEWEWKKKNLVYEAEFIINSIKYDAHFSKDGIWLKTNNEIHKTEIPQAIWNSISASEYAAWEVDDVEHQSNATYQSMYEIEVKKGKKEVLLYFLTDGRRIDVK